MSRTASLTRLSNRMGRFQMQELEAREKSRAVEDRIMGLLTKREARRVDWLRTNLNECEQKVARALGNVHGWRKTWDELNQRHIYLKPYSELPFYWRIVARYFDAAQFREEDGHSIFYRFRTDGIQRERRLND